MSSPFLEIRKLFPQIQHMDSNNECYLDSASTTLKINFIIDTLKEIYETKISNVHRGDHHLSLEMTQKYEEARSQVAQFLGAASPEEIIFTRGTTEGVNCLAQILGQDLKEGDEVLISEMEHHSNFIPWQILCEKKKLKLKIIPVLQDGTIQLKDFEQALTDRTKIFSIVHVSNATGVVNPVEEMIRKAKQKGAYTILDAAQSIALLDIQVQKLDCDFLVFSGHKIFAPSGIGILFGKKSHLDQLPPFQVGGGMISDVSLDSSKWAASPNRFEAGTPFIEGAIVLGKVLSFFRKNISCQELFDYEKNLIQMAATELSQIPGLKIIGSKENQSNILSFIIEDLNSSDISYIMTQTKVAVRAGHHCCLPLMKKLKLQSGTVRASFSVYNREEDIEMLKQSVLKSCAILRGN